MQSESQEPNHSDREMWTPFECEPLDFRYVQDPVYNLSDAELLVLSRLRDEGLVFSLLPRFDPTNFVRIQVRLGSQSQRVDLAVDEGARYVSVIAKRTPLTDQIMERLVGIFGQSFVDRERSVSTANYVWVSFFLEPFRRPGRMRNSLFNFDRNEQAFLEALEASVRRQKGLEFHIYPRGTTFGGVELMITDGRNSQMARIFVKGKAPVTYHVVTENTSLGRRLLDYLQVALGEGHMDQANSRTAGKFLSLIYSV